MLCTDYLTTQENYGKSQVGNRLKFMKPVIASNGVSCLEMASVASQSMSKRENKGMKNKEGAYFNFQCLKKKSKAFVLHFM